MSFRQSGNDLTKSGSSKNLNSTIVSASPPTVSTTSKRQVISNTGTLPYQRHAVERQNSSGEITPDSAGTSSFFTMIIVNLN